VLPLKYAPISESEEKEMMVKMKPNTTNEKQKDRTVGAKQRFYLSRWEENSKTYPSLRRVGIRVI